MAPAAKKDIFTNRASISVSETAINTMSFSKLETGVSIFEKMAFVVSRIEYRYDPFAWNINSLSSADELSFGWVRDQQLATFPHDDPSIIDHGNLSNVLSGVAANLAMHHMPVVHDYSTLPGGGLIIPSAPLYLAILGTGATVVNTVSSLMYFTTKALKPEEYWELVESLRIIT